MVIRDEKEIARGRLMTGRGRGVARGRQRFGQRPTASPV